MKTTIDLPDLLFRKAKATAAERGISLKTFITEAVETRLSSPPPTGGPVIKPWMKILHELPRVSKEVLGEIHQRVSDADAADIELQKAKQP